MVRLSEMRASINRRAGYGQSHRACAQAAARQNAQGILRRSRPLGSAQAPSGAADPNRMSTVFDEIPIDAVRNYWNSRPCNLRHSPAPIGSRQYFDEVDARKYFVE